MKNDKKIKYTSEQIEEGVICSLCGASSLDQGTKRWARDAASKMCICDACFVTEVFLNKGPGC